MKKHRIIITGSAGLLGYHLYNHLAGQGHYLLGIDDLSGGWEPNTKGQHFVKLNLQKSQKLEKIFKKFKPDIIHHLAAHPWEGLSQFCPEDVTANTYNNSLSVYRAMINCGDVDRLVYYSSMSRYGHGGYKPPFSEDYPRAPEDIYAIAKCSAERALEILASIHKFSYVIAVPHNVFGEGVNLSDPYRNVLAIWASAILRGKPVYIYGDGTQSRACSYVADMVEPMARLGFDDRLHGEIINLGSRQVYTINALAQMVIEAYGLAITPVNVEDRPCEVKDAYCTIDKSEKLLGFKDKTLVEDGIKKLVDWVKRVGSIEPQYFDQLEIENCAPRVWVEKKLL